MYIYVYTYICMFSIRFEFLNSYYLQIVLHSLWEEFVPSPATRHQGEMDLAHVALRPFHLQLPHNPHTNCPVRSPDVHAGAPVRPRAPTRQLRSLQEAPLLLR